MSIATKQPECLQPFDNPYYKQQVSTVVPEEQQQWNRKKSIDTIEIIKSEKHVTKSKQLPRQKTPVVDIETEEGEQEHIVTSKSENEEREGVSKNTTFKDIYEDFYGGDDTEEEEADYQIYQDGKVNEFFNDELVDEPPKTIADICLVNDHYILVKMMGDIVGIKEPENAAVTQRKDLKSIRLQNETIQKEIATRNNKKLYRYLKAKRHRVTRIAPIHEESEESIHSEGEITKQSSKSHCLNVQYCWKKANDEDTEETYQTQTKIIKTLSNSQKNMQKSSQDTKNIPKDILKTQELQTISGSLLKSSLHHQVTLHNYGSLISRENNNNLEVGDCHKNYPSSSPPPRRKCPRFESFYWLLRPFRGKYRKPKPKIQAVVYKQYFVKWTKPPDTLTHGYGVQTTKLSEVSVLRRCRSAIF